MNWFGKFMIFLAIAVVAVTCGMTVYYLARVNEVITLNESVVNANKGEQFTVTVERKDAQEDTKIEMVIGDTNVVALANTENMENGSVVFTFDALTAGSTSLTLNSSKEEYNNQNCTVYIGDGTQENPYFVRNAEDLTKIGTVEGYALDANYKLVSDIDLGAYKCWTPIGWNVGAFDGTMDGAGYTIYNLTIMQYQTNEDGTPAEGFPEADLDIAFAGLFGGIGKTGVVENLNFSHAGIYDGMLAGVVAGENQGTIKMVSVTDSTVTQVSEYEFVQMYAGGIVGCNSGRIDRVSFVGTLSGDYVLGGIAALNERGTIINSYTKGVMIPTKDTAEMAGIAARVAGDTVAKSYIINTYSVMTVAQQEDGTFLSDKMGMILNTNYNPNGTSFLIDQLGENRIYGNYYVSEQGFKGIYNTDDYMQRYFVMSSVMDLMSNMPTEADVAEAIRSQGAIATEQDEVTKAPYITYYGNSEPTSWNFDNVWMIDRNVNGGLPTLRTAEQEAEVVVDMIYDVDPGSKILVTNEAQLRNIGYNLEGNYLINADIVLTSPWTPVGTEENPFNGKITVAKNGENYYTISNLVIDSKYADAGFFGVIGKDAQIVGLNIVNAEVEGGNGATGATGVIAGKNFGLLQDCAVTGTSVINANANATMIGGIVGSNRGNIRDVVSTVNVNLNTGTTAYTGGIVGQNYAVINGAEYYGSIIVADEYKNSIHYAGGIAGATYAQIADAYAEANIDLGNVNADTMAGGIVAVINHDGQVKASGSNSVINAYNAGGIAGQINTAQSAKLAVTSSFSSNKVSGTNVAGIVVEFKQGKVTNVSTTVTLLGSEMAGLAKSFEKNATIETSFVNVKFEGDGHKHLDTCTKYLHTEAGGEIMFGRAVGTLLSKLSFDALKDSMQAEVMAQRCGGIMTNCVFNTTNGGSLQAEQGFTPLAPAIKTTSEGVTTEGCADAAIFISKGFDTDVWTFGLTPGMNTNAYGIYMQNA
ncbi:MAG: hypothetical protein IKC79_02140 [Clostridia bacterium]|nr:hypothetical protein [Clostridia bacterium]